MLFAPSLKLLEYLGMVTTEKMGNIIEPSKVYGDDMPLHDFFNGIENGKAFIEDTYINYLPFYVNIVTTVKNIKINFNQPLNNVFSKLAEEPIPVYADITETLQNTETIKADDTATMSKPADSSPYDGAPYIVKHTSKYLTNSGGTNL